MQQNRRLWDWSLIRRALTRLAAAQTMTASPAGPYVLQAMIAAGHARAATAAETDWPSIAAAYHALAAIAPSPVVEINRAVAVGMAFGPAYGLAIADALREEPKLAQSHLLPTVRGEFLEKLGRKSEAATEFRRAAALTENERERALLLRRAELN